MFPVSAFRNTGNVLNTEKLILKLYILTRTTPVWYNDCVLRTRPGTEHITNSSYCSETSAAIWTCRTTLPRVSYIGSLSDPLLYVPPRTTVVDRDRPFYFHQIYLFFFHAPKVRSNSRNFSGFFLGFFIFGVLNRVRSILGRLPVVAKVA